MTLYEEIMIRVEVYGGVEAVCRDIYREWGYFIGNGESFHYTRTKPHWTEQETKYLARWHRKLTVQKLSKRLGKSQVAILRKIHAMQKAAQ